MSRKENPVREETCKEHLKHRQGSSNAAGSHVSDGTILSSTGKHRMTNRPDVRLTGERSTRYAG